MFGVALLLIFLVATRRFWVLLFAFFYDGLRNPVKNVGRHPDIHAPWSDGFGGQGGE